MDSSPFLYEDDVLVRKWKPPTQSETIHQTVLPVQCRETVLRMAHLAPWAGHFGCTKNTMRILKRFFWPGIRGDVADLCK